MYARLENGVVVETRPRLNWTDDQGNRIADDAVYRAQGWYPVKSSMPEHDRLTQRIVRDPMDQWIVGTETVTATYSVEDLPLEQAQGNYLRSLRTERQQRLAAGFRHDGDTWSADAEPIQRLLMISARINAGRGLPRGQSQKALKTVGGTVRQLNATQIEELAVAGSDLVDAVDETAAVLEGQIMAATTLAELRNIDLTAGWPD